MTTNREDIRAFVQRNWGCVSEEKPMVVDDRAPEGPYSVWPRQDSRREADIVTQTPWDGVSAF